MKPPPFEYRDPETLDEALELLAEAGEEAAILAGGQSLVPLLNLRLAHPELVIDLRRVPDLDRIEEEGGALRLGAMARAAALERYLIGNARVPNCVREALRLVGHPQIRNRTTIGGNLAHADPSSELPAVFLALEGRLVLRSKSGGEHRVPAAEFFLGPFTTARRPDELIVGAELPAFSGRTTFLELARRPGDFCLVGACLAVSFTEQVVSDARIAICGAGSCPARLQEAEAVLVGERLTVERIQEAARVSSGSVSPRADLHASAEYRAAMVGVLVERGLRRLMEVPG